MSGANGPPDGEKQPSEAEGTPIASLRPVRRRGPRLAARVRAVRRADRATLLASAILVLLLLPAWMDPSTFDVLVGAHVPGDAGALPSPSARATGQLFSPEPASQPQSSPRILARDRFARSSSEGWGTADVGGNYTIRGNVTDLAIERTGASVRLPAAGSARTAVLADAHGHDVRLLIAFTVDALPESGRLYIYGLLRSQPTGDSYRPQVHVTATGEVFVHAGLMLVGRERSLGRPVPVPDITLSPGDVMWMRAEALDSDPTTIRVRAWADGTEEPAYWHFAVIDWSGSLQGSGAVGVAGYLGTRTINAPVVVHFTDLLATTIDAPRN